MKDAKLINANSLLSEKHGRWIRTGGYFEGAYDDIDYFSCSECNFEVPIESEDFWSGNYAFCPYCGSRMDGEENDRMD